MKQNVGEACGTHANGEETVQGFWWEIPMEGDHLEDGGKDGRMGLEWILGRWAGGCGGDSPGSEEGSVACSRESGDEPSGSGATESLCNLFTEIIQPNTLKLQGD
jgi:hypothetical protein